MIEFIDFDIKISKDDFTDLLDDVIANNNDFDEIEYQVQEKQTKFGKTLYVIHFDDNGNSETFDVIADKPSPTANEMWFHYMKLQNFNYSFVRTSSPATYEDIYCRLISEALSKSALHTKNGKFVAIYSGNGITVIEKGKKLDGKNYDIAVRDVVKDKYYYRTTDVSDESASEEEDDEDDFQITKFKVKKPIFEWVKENPDLVKMVEGKSDISERMNIIGKFLMKKKLDGDLDSDLFINLYRQCGIIGFSDPTTKKFYSLLM